MAKSPLPEGSLIVFDLDGTLVDSAWDLISTLNKVITKQGLPPISRDCVGHIVGQGAMKMLEKAYNHFGKELDNTLQEALLKEFLAIYEIHLADETQPFEGIRDLLNKLKKKGWLLAVCTNKYEKISKKLLKILELDHYFEAICGSDTFSVRKPDPQHLLGTVEKAGGKREHTIMIGDSKTDIDTAKAANIPIIAVTFGYTDVDVSSLNPTKTVEHSNEIYAEIKRIKSNFTL